MSRAASTQRRRPLNKGRDNRGRALAAGDGPASAPSTGYLAGERWVRCQDPWDGDGSLARPPCTPGDFSALNALCRASCLQPTELSPEAARKRYLPRGPLSPRPAGVIVQGLSFYRFPRRPGQAGNSLEFPTIVQREAGSGQTGSRSAQAGSSPPARRAPMSTCPKGTRVRPGRGSPWAATRGEFPHRCERESPAPQLW